MKVGAPLPLDQTDMGKVRNAPFATNLSLFFDFDSLSREGVFFDDFPPGPESFFPFYSD